MFTISGFEYVISTVRDVIYIVLNMLESLLGKGLFSILMFLFLLAVFSGLFDALRTISKKLFYKILMFPIREQAKLNKSMKKYELQQLLNEKSKQSIFMKKLSSFHIFHWKK